MKIVLDLSNDATKTDTSSFAKKVDLAYLKSDVDKLDNGKLKKVTTILRNFKSKVDKLDVDKLVPVLVDLSKLSDAVKSYVFKKDIYNAKIKIIEDKIPDITISATDACLNVKQMRLKVKHLTLLT